MAAIPFPTDGTTPQGSRPSSTPSSISTHNQHPSTDQSQQQQPQPQPPTTLTHANTAIGSMSIQHPPHSAGLPITSTANPSSIGPGQIAIPPPPLKIGYGYGGAETHGPPSPSTLTDVILGLHATLYAGKKSADEVLQMVSRFYDPEAVFESPLLQAKGREQIANQFKMAFALPGMDVQSELRDVICSDFEFDGTRAGIIDHTLTISLFPTLFGPSSYATGSHGPTGAASGAGYAGRSGLYSSHFGGGGPGRSYAGSVHGDMPTGGSTPSYFQGRQSGPASAGVSSFTIPGANSSSYFNQMHPFTPMSAVQTPHAFGRTTSTFGFSSSHDNYNDNGFDADDRNYGGKESGGTTSSRRRSLSGKGKRLASGFYDDDDMDPERDGETTGGRQLSYSMGGPGSYSGHAGSIAGGDDELSGELSFSTQRDPRSAGPGTVAVSNRPAMPAEALVPHWSASGFGRASVRAFVWGLFHPRAALKALCSFQIRVMTRLEFNDNGMIVRHEDMWSVREAIEGMVPFAGLVYQLERRIVGFFVSWAVAKGLTISQLLLSRAIDNQDEKQHDHRYQQGQLPPSSARPEWRRGDEAAHPQEVERALLLHQQSLDRDRERGSIAGHSRQPTFSSLQGEYPYATFSRSRAPSPTRRFGSISGAGGSTTSLVTGTRSRARSLISSNPHIRAASSQNLLSFTSGANWQQQQQQQHN
ncbi:hypothetical protein OC846_006254 [Tilletia horrida]|uniref:Uncharacterized protein n=1 Tax=Tilletia horrida TaxID=155126 RepID=A0AAN6GJ76_9BASI|nr:hypothetical protein OC846_006254 [Tilletia horrida]